MRRLLWFAACTLAACVLLFALAAAWLYTDAHRDRDDWFAERHGILTGASVSSAAVDATRLTERVTLTSSSGLQVQLRVVRPAATDRQLPVLLLLGGQRTGADAVDLFDDVSDRIVVALDYPYDGPARTRGFLQTASAVPAIRRAFLDASPAIWLATDWIVQQNWADEERLALAGVSLGVPFAATAAAHDERIRALLLVHGAADNRAWVRRAIEMRRDLGPLLGPAANIGNWIVYGPVHDTAQHVAEVAPRPVIIIGARDDERVPAGQTESLYASAGEPKRLRYSNGRHVQPGRRDIVRELLRIAEAELGAALPDAAPAPGNDATNE